MHNKKSNIYHNASIKLATAYMIITVIISLTFSFWLYNVSISEIRSSVLRVPGPVEQLLRRENNRFAQELRDVQDQAIEDARSNLIYQFVVLNVVIAIGGAFSGYYLARKTLRPIEDAHEAQSRFTADASHELRTPIAAMRVETEITLTEPKLTVAQAKKQLESNIEELDKLTALSEGLLQLAQIENGGLEKEPVLLETTINSAVNRTNTFAKNKYQKITVGKIAVKKVNAHEESIIEALVAILENAVKYSPEKSSIKIATKSQNKSVVISVTDQGSGISTKDLPHIFDRFYRADQSRTESKTNGYGIGLSVAKSIVNAHNGSITATSSPKGSTFTITLPLS